MRIFLFGIFKYVYIYTLYNTYSIIEYKIYMYIMFSICTNMYLVIYMYGYIMVLERIIICTMYNRKFSSEIISAFNITCLTVNFAVGIIADILLSCRLIVKRPKPLTKILGGLLSPPA